MSNCTVCGSLIEHSSPMVLVGNKLFVKGAGNGRAWSGPAPAVRLWKTFGLLSVGVCQKCAEQYQQELKRLTMRNLILTVGFIMVTYLSTFVAIKNTPAILLPYAFGITALVFMIKFVDKLIASKRKGDVGEIVIAHYLKSKIIPQKDILAVTSHVYRGIAGDINIKESMSMSDYFLGTGSYLYNLQLFPQEELFKIGKISEGSGYAASYIDLEEACLDARALFEKIGLLFEI
ncbi:MAG: hypothetical protein ACYCX2_05695 [Christensenellales bacterium]